MKAAGQLFVALVLLFSLAHAQPGGELDSTYDFDGWRVDTFPQAAVGYAISVMGDGRVVASGKTTQASVVGFEVVRYLPDGARDTSLGGVGKVFVQGPSIVTEYTSMAVQIDGKVLLSSASTASGMPRTIIQRILVNGQIDSAFAVGGTFTQPNRTSNFYSKRIHVRPDGKILWAADVVSGPAVHFGAGRLLPDGAIDTSYGMGGISILQPTDQLYWVNDAAFFSDGSMVMIGTCDSMGTNRTCVLRLDHQGAPVTSFGTNGFVYLPSTAFATVASVVEIDAAGRFYLAGTQTANLPNIGVRVCRLTANGQIDQSFGQQGFVTLSDPVRSLFVTDMITDAGNRLVLVGSAADATSEVMAVRLDQSGALDNAFGNGGMKIYPYNGHDSQAQCVARQPDSKLVMAGKATPFGEVENFLTLRIDMDMPLETAPLIGTTKLQAWPNPAHNRLMLKWEQLETGPVSMKMLDLTGKIVLELPDLGHRNAGPQTQEIALDSLSAGVYLLEVHAAASISYLRVVKE